MARPKKEVKMYQSNAEKQAAYRARHAHRKPPTIRRTYNLAHALFLEINKAAMEGDERALRLRGRNHEEVLENLIKEVRYEDESKTLMEGWGLGFPTDL